MCRKYRCVIMTSYYLSRLISFVIYLILIKINNYSYCASSFLTSNLPSKDTIYICIPQIFNSNLFLLQILPNFLNFIWVNTNSNSFSFIRYDLSHVGFIINRIERELGVDLNGDGYIGGEGIYSNFKQTF